MDPPLFSVQCQSICQAKYNKLLKDDMKFSHSHVWRLSSLVTTPTIGALIAKRFKRCFKKFDREDKSKDCGGNRQFVECGLKVVDDICEYKFSDIFQFDKK